MAVTKVFLSWNGDLLSQAVQYLLARRPGSPTDLSDVLVLVPTVEAGRRLRCRLALEGSGGGGAVLTGKVMTPAAFLSSMVRGRCETPELQQLSAWLRAVLEARDAGNRVLFPEDMDRVAEIATARRFLDLEKELASAGKSFSEIAGLLGRGDEAFPPPEAERWSSLAGLWERVRENLRGAGLQDLLERRLQAARNPEMPTGCRLVVCVGLACWEGSAKQALEKLAQTIEVVLLVHAPQEEAEAFDDWGNPREEVWSARKLGLRGDAIVRCADQAELISRVLEVFRHEAGGRPALAVLDPELESSLIFSARVAGLDLFDPGGAPMARHELVLLLRVLAEFREQPTLSRFLAAVQHPAVRRHLERLRPPAVCSELADSVDKLAHATCHLDVPGLLASGDKELRAQREQVKRVAVELDRLAGLLRGDVAEGARRLFLELYRQQSWDGRRPADAIFMRGYSQLRELQSQLHTGPAASFAEGPYAGGLLDDCTARQAVNLEPLADSVPSLGWLDLPFEDAPDLLIAGASDGKLPAYPSDRAFLVDSLRRAAGLPDRQCLLARDAYLLHCLVEQRRACGTVRLLHAVQTPDGQYAKPSPLFFACSEEELPGRVLEQFAPPELQPRRRIADPGLTFDRVPFGGDRHLSASALKDYLECPFLFFLKRVQGMVELQESAVELDDMAFGLLAHKALEHYGKQPALADCTDRRRIEDCMLQWLDVRIGELFGKEPPPLVAIQLAALRQRLAALAGLMADSRLEGWRVVGVERDFTLSISEQGLAFDLAGKIDWIERKGTTLRVLDLKTGDTVRGPADAHLGREREGTPPEEIVVVDGKRRAWVDLQLPIYVMAVEQFFSGTPSAGYICLPAAAGDSAIMTWDQLPELQAAAVATMLATARKIYGAPFWPPKPWARETLHRRYFLNKPASLARFVP